jgi:2-polyprenyl-3-methyl-5-hydroxy-6-metoxy-1,4-benzoquinol methylase
MPQIIFSTFVDAAPKFELQGLTWAVSLLAAGIAPDRIVVHHAPGVSSSLSAALGGLEVRTREVAPHESGHSYCNKLQQLTQGRWWEDRDLLVLCDADLLWLDPTRVPQVQFAGKIVDRPNPPAEHWRRILHEAGHSSPMVPVDFAAGAEDVTPATNLNGGLYLVAGSAAAAVADAWRDRVEWLSPRSDLLNGYANYRDQVAMSLALLDLELDPVHLDRGWNLPTHLEPQLLEQPRVHVRALHHHDRRDEVGRLLPVGVDWIDAAITEANRLVDLLLGSLSAHPLFWDWRYREMPELGSGIGSRGDVAVLKQRALAAAVAAHPDWSVVELGCGDLVVSENLPVRSYLGIDTSREALALAATRRPDWRFAHPEELDGSAGHADLAICLDVLIHQSESEIVASLAWLRERARARLVVSGFERPPALSSTTHFLRPLSSLLADAFPGARMFPLAEYRGLTMLAVDVTGGRSANRHDIDDEMVAQVLPQVGRPDLLYELIDRSRSKLGFFPATPTRCVEYPWFLEAAEELAAGSSIVDLGTGVCALPLALAARGHSVTTTDSHPDVRTAAGKADWDEWGFLDYSSIDPRIASVHEPFERAALGPQDAVFSVSVVEHMPAVVRRQAFDHAAGMLAPGGILLLSMDLVPGTTDLWNFCWGVEVDAPGAHGTLPEIALELERAGFAVDPVQISRGIPRSRTDIALIRARRT